MAEDSYITSILKENRVFNPSDEFRRNARIKSMQEYEELYKKSIENPQAFWAEKANDLDLVATIYNNRGALANVQGQREKALACYAESLPCFEKIGNTRALSNTYLNMAMAHADNGNWFKAGHYYDRSNQLAREIGDAHLQATHEPLS